MAQTKAKRSLPQPTSSKPRKKRKENKAQDQRPSTSEARTVSADGLDWTNVPLPDRLEDAEGFLGLEEVDDVQVFRVDNGKSLRFQVCLC